MFEQLKRLILEIVEVDPELVTRDALLQEDLGFNSYEMMSLLGLLEDEFGINIDMEEVVALHASLNNPESPLRTVGDAVKLVESKL